MAKAEASLKRLTITPAQPKAGSAFEQHSILSVFIQLTTPHAVKVHYRRAMNAAKHSRVQILLQF